MDNLSSHKTELLKEFYMKNRINIIFNSPYMSNFNSIELFFRLIKRIIYQRLYTSTKELIESIINIIDDDKINESLKQNFRETLEEYYKFSIVHKNSNLNNFKY